MRDIFSFLLVGIASMVFLISQSLYAMWLTTLQKLEFNEDSYGYFQEEIEESVELEDDASCEV